MNDENFQSFKKNPFNTTYKSLKSPGSDELYLSLENMESKEPTTEDLDINAFEWKPSIEYDELNQGFRPMTAFVPVQQHIQENQIDLMDFMKQPFRFHNQFPALAPKGFMKSEIQEKNQILPTNFFTSNQKEENKFRQLIHHIDESWNFDKNPTNMSEMDPNITKNKSVPKRFPIPKISPRNNFKKKQIIEEENPIDEILNLNLKWTNKILKDPNHKKFE
jgi:hypothetical protein